MERRNPLCLDQGSAKAKEFFDSAKVGLSDDRPLAYVAGPLFGSGRASNNVYRALHVGAALAAAGITPFVPHLFLFWDSVDPHDAAFWLQIDFAMLRRADVLVLLPGESPGAEAEQLVAASCGIPVFALDEQDVRTTFSSAQPRAWPWQLCEMFKVGELRVGENRR